MVRHVFVLGSPCLRSRLYLSIQPCVQKISAALSSQFNPIIGPIIDYSVSEMFFFNKRTVDWTRVLSKHLARLRPFVNSSGVIRVGGHLQHSHLNYNCKTSMLMAKRSHLATLIYQRQHKITCHAGLSKNISVIVANCTFPRIVAWERR